ncbi:MAG: heparinase II/III family protein [Kiritimatiellaeota bacterium]|nr:heparinase II/III family protein [Kiritimatiellota bacterium]
MSHTYVYGAEQSADLTNRFAKLPAHPRLGHIANNGFSDVPDYQPYLTALTNEARKIAALPPVEYKMTGRRLLNVSREALRRISTLAAAYIHTRDADFLRRAEAEMLAACAFPTWNPDHYLDVAEMSLAVAIGYDWLHDDLTPEARELIAEGLWKHGLSLGAEQIKLEKPAWWVSARSNWGQVCHAGMTAAALALAERHPQEALSVIDRAFREFRDNAATGLAPDGAYEEGAGYWAYGAGFHAVFAIITESALGTHYGVDALPGFLRSAEYMRHVTGPTGHIYNYADNGEHKRRCATLLWFADRYPERFGGRASGYFGEEYAALTQYAHAYAGDRMAPFMLLAGRQLPVSSFDKKVSIDTLDFHGRGPSEVVFMRSAWNDKNARFLGIKAGRQPVNHGHIDVGSFIYESDGVRWAIDPGMENYTALEERGTKLWDSSEDGDRWRIFRYNEHGHNIARIASKRPNLKAAATIAQMELDVENPRVVLDMTAIHDVPSTRTFEFQNRDTLRITDEFHDLAPGEIIIWQILTRAKAEARGNVLTLTQDGKKLKIETANENAVWKIERADTLTNEWDSPVGDLLRVSYIAVVDANGTVLLTTELKPEK